MVLPSRRALWTALVAVGAALITIVGGGSVAHAQDDGCVEVLPGVFDCSGSTTTTTPPTTAPPTTAPPTTAPPTTAPPTTAPPTTAPPTTAPPATAPPVTAPPATAPPPPPAPAPPTTAAPAPTTAPTTTEAPSLSDQDISRSEAGRIDLGEIGGDDDGGDPTDGVVDDGAVDDGTVDDGTAGDGTAGDGDPTPETAVVGGVGGPADGEGDGGLQRADIDDGAAARDIDGENNGLLFLVAPIAAGLVIVAAVAAWTVLQGSEDREPVGAGATTAHASAFDD